MRLCENNGVKDFINKDVLETTIYDFSVFCGLDASRIWQFRLAYKTYDLDIYGVLHTADGEIPYKFTICYAYNVNYQSGMLVEILRAYIDDKNPNTNDKLTTLIRTYMWRHNFPKRTSVSIYTVKELTTNAIEIYEICA